MANYIDEFAVKVTADSSKLTKELKKLGKQINSLFHNRELTNGMKQTAREYQTQMAIALDSDNRTFTKKFLNNYKKSLKERFKLYKDYQKKAVASGNSRRAEIFGGMAKSIKRSLKNPFANVRRITDEALKSEYGSGRTAGYHHFMSNPKAEKYLKSNNAFWEDYGFKDQSEALERAGEVYRRLIQIEGRQGKSYQRERESLLQEQEYLKGTFKEYGKFEKYIDTYRDMQKREKQIQKAAETQQGKKGGIAGFFQTIWQKITELPRLLGRIFIRYLGYQVIKNLFGSVQEGVQNLYTWSRYHNQEFSKLLDKSKSLTVALGNAFALVKTYATMWFERIGNNFKEMLIDLMNLLSKAIAFATGQKTYVQANKDIMIRWADNNATTRQLIQGFDKLNIWKGTDNTLPQDMFTEYAFKDYNIQNIGEMIIDFFKGPFWGLLKTAWSVVWETAIKPVIATLFGPEILAAQDTSTALKALWAKIKVWWNGVTTEDEGDNGEIITRQVEPGFKHALVEWFGSTWEKIKEFFKGLWTEKISPKFQEWWGKFKEWWNSQIDPILDKAADKLREWWLTRKQSTTYEVEDWVYDKTGAVIDIEDTLRQFKRLMPWNWGKENLNASGGVYTTPHFGIVGEASTRANPELITPTALLDDRLQANNRELLGAMNGMMNNLIGAVNGINMEVKIGDDVIARSASRGNNAYYKMTGRPLIR